MITERNYKYVLFGQFQSDAIEKRFGKCWKLRNPSASGWALWYENHWCYGTNWELRKCFLNEYDCVADQNIIFSMLLGTLHAVSAESWDAQTVDICVAQNDENELNFYLLNTTDQASSRASLLEQVKRGGLCTPSQTVCISTLYNRNFDCEIFSHKEI